MAQNPWEMDWKDDEEESTDAVEATAAKVNPWEMNWSAEAAPVKKQPYDHMKPYEGQGLVEANINYAKDYGKGVASADRALGAELMENPLTAQPKMLLGGLETAATVGTSIAAPILGAADWLATKAGVFDENDPRNPEGTYAGARNKYIYEPRSDAGQALTGELGAIAKPLGDVASVLGKNVANVSGVMGASEETQENIREVVPDAVGYLIGGKKIGKPVLKAADDAATAVKNAVDSPEAFAKNSEKLYKREFEDAHGRNIDIKAKRTATEAAQEQAIGKWLSDNEINKIKGKSEQATVDAKLERVRQIKEDAGKNLGSNDNAITELAKDRGLGPIKIKTDEVIKSIVDDPRYLEAKKMHVNEKVSGVYDALAEKVKSLGTKSLSFDELSKLKEGIANKINWADQTASEANNAYKSLWHKMDDAQEKILANADKLASAPKSKGLIKKLRKDKDNYAKASEVEEGLVKQRGKAPEGFEMTAHGITHAIKSARTKTGKVAAVVGGLVGHQAMPLFGTVAGGYIGGKVGDAVSRARTVSKVKKSRFYTPPSTP